MKWPSILMLVLVLFAPVSSLGAQFTCCSDGASTDPCCEPQGACPESRDGECVRAAAVDVFKLALPKVGTPSLAPFAPVVLAMAPIALERPLRLAREPAHIPRYLRFHSLRN
ncbi:MAG: hypothetical protein ABIU54_03200 [Candidatus Eisenbacteria bacterium]